MRSYLPCGCLDTPGIMHNDNCPEFGDRVRNVGLGGERKNVSEIVSGEKTMDVDEKGHCSRCGGTHYGSGRKCVYTDEEIKAMNEPAHKDEIKKFIQGDHPTIIRPAQTLDPGPIMCIYHFPCADGFGAAWAMRRLMPKANIEFIPAKYGDEPPDVTGRIVYILDFSYPREVIADMLTKALRLLVLDHHESALKNLVGLDAGDPAYFAQTQQKGAATEYTDGMKFWVSDGGHILLDMSRSGAGMAWDYFSQMMKKPQENEGEPRPELINHIEDRDLWKFKLYGTKEISATIFSHEYDFEVWNKLMQEDPQTLAIEGAGILRKQMKDTRELLRACTREFVIAGHRVPCANMPYTMSSEGCHMLLEQYPDAPFAAAYFDTAKGRQFSLRSEDSRVNVSEVAMLFKGGGHRNASGFTVKTGWEGDELVYAGQDNGR